MAIPVPVLVVVSVVVSAYTKLNAVILGRPVSVSPLLLIAAVMLLTLVVLVLLIARTLIRDSRPSPYPRTA